MVLPHSNFKGIQWKDSEGNLLHGAVDNLLVKNGKLIVLDYKTRGYALKDDTANHYQDQLDIYSFLLSKNGKDVEDYAYLLFYIPSKVHENGEVNFTTQLVKMSVDSGNAEKILHKALKVLKGPLPDADVECEWCSWLKTCANYGK